ncbi:DUF4159 domain-containing protein [Beijerinckia sp. L45]|uniref:DUF4159 domain-containing protein n=1 Tax=Beijerinckia sp. L45 TaxID=1641855 RepID=UPI00131B0C4A|nr:DUF4159 domain-containing protein [Beijerinckia sp. L45]
MLGLPLAFTIPLALAALAGLPVLYVLLRVTPPRPRRIPFPPLKLILDLKPKDETPANTPWWLLVLRLVIACAIILAMAGPIWNPLSVGGAGAGPLLLVMDDGWPAAPSWDRRVIAAAQRIEAARQNSQVVAVAAMSDAGKDVVPVDAPKALERLRALKPVPYTPDRLAELPAIERFVAAHPKTSTVWIADGLERGNARSFADGLSALPVDTTLVADGAPSVALTGPQNDSGALDVRVLRSANGGLGQGFVRALDLKGLTIGQAPFTFGTENETKARFDLPIELRNDIARLEIVGGHSAGTVSLLDARWKRRRVGIVSGETADTAQPLLAPNYYLVKALSPFADVHEAKPGAVDPIGALLDEHVSVLILADIGTISGAMRDRLSQFVDGGGMLVRFAGTRLSAAADDLVPVRLRRGGRVLGGSLSWETPKKLAAFEPPSPFVGLKVPNEVTISRQVLAEPDTGLPGKTWAQLSDGTPLVTADIRGKGRVVLFHVTADTTWSNLPISGLFVDMLRKIVAMSGDARTDITADAAPAPVASKVETVAPSRSLDGFGTLGPPPPTAKPVPTTFAGVSSIDHPSGFYGAAESLLAVNALAPNDRIPAATFAGLRFRTAPLQAAEPVDLRPWLIGTAFLLFVLDSLASLWLAGKLPRLPRRAVPAALALMLAGFALVPAPTPAHAASPATEISPRDMASALQTRLAYVVSGDARVDEISKQGLSTLSATLTNRTSLNAGEPVGIDPAKDDLAFYPLLYWPVVAGVPQPSPAATAKIAAFMRQGGTIVFDTRDALSTRSSGPPTAETAWLRQLLADVDVPELEPVPPSHVVTKTFYLLDAFVGRYASGQTWIEALPPAIGDTANRPARSGDGVSPIIVTGNDLASGWAGDEYGEALYPLVPGDPRQHEMALRGGVNLVMYTLTGNYKADQVHVRDLLERLAH